MYELQLHDYKAYWLLLTPALPTFLLKTTNEWQETYLTLYEEVFATAEVIISLTF